MTNKARLTEFGDLPHFRAETIKDDDVAWVILEGEADISTLLELDVALAHVELDAAKCVHLQLAELDFADAATIHRLTAFASRAKQRGHDVKTWGASPALRMALGVLGVQHVLGLA